MGSMVLVHRHLADGSRSRSLPTISNHLCPRHLEQRILRRLQKLNGHNWSFTVGNLGGRTLVIYTRMAKNVCDSRSDRVKRLLTLDTLQLDSVFSSPRTGYWKDKRGDERLTFGRVEGGMVLHLSCGVYMPFLRPPRWNLSLSVLLAFGFG